ncbi:LLM class flavin-dependent oxidoreductase [Pseudomonas sp. LRF_L74]|uniref:LLM class flavin-dependent oxidoreductase n=1 Tax=Pseudomonas sp. LRF_L74 TaxID=3369422 RepID=UPI003F6097DE
MSARQMKLGLFLSGYGHHLAAWRQPGAQSLFEFANSLRWVRQAEAAGFDLVFLSDTPAIKSHGSPVDWRGPGGVRFEPLTLLAALAVQTSRIGLVATATTSYEAPYHLARKFASLDHLSAGRAGWNIVTSSSPAVAGNFGSDGQLEHDLRYRKAAEFVEVVKRLWDSWEDDAFLVDRKEGRFYDPGKLHVTGHRGEFFAVAGPLNIARPPQGHPVLVQAGSSEAGLDLAAQSAEVVFTAQQRFEDALHFAGRLRQRLVAGRQVRIMPGVTLHVGRSRSEAEDKFQRLQDLIHPEVGRKLLSGMAGGFDFSGYPLDGPLPALPPTNGNRSRQQLLEELASREALDLRGLYQRLAAARGHWTLVGTAGELVDQLQHWFEAGAADGFNIMPPWLPGGLDDILELVVPELRRRGLFRQRYGGSTLREHLGLDRPANGFAHGEARA